MKLTEITTDKSNLALSYNFDDEVLTGQNEFYVTINDIGDEPSDNNLVTFTADESLIIEPSSFEATPGEPQYVSVRLSETVIPEGQYNFSILMSSEYSADKTVNAALVSSNKTFPDDVFKTKYFIQREGYICFISELVTPSQSVQAIEVNGTVDLSYQEKKDIFDPILSATLKIELEASLDLTFEDLYSESEKTFKVSVQKGTDVVFQGFILPDGIWQDFVNEKWKISITANCGLASLKNIAFAQKNSVGNNLVNFAGRMSAIEIISNCLEKTGLNLPIYVNCQIFYENIYAWNNILSSIYLSVERYFQNVDEPMNCDEVLRSVMQIFGASIFQHKNAWYIHRPKDMVNTNPFNTSQQNLLFSVFFGTIFQQNVLLQFGDVLGSNVNGSEKFHVNENQRVTISPSIQAYQISYEFGDSKNILANGGLMLEGTAGYNIPGWTVHNTGDGSVGRGVINGYSYGIRHIVKPFDPEYPLLLSLNQSIDIKANSNIKLKIKFRNTGINSLYLNFRWGVSNGTQTVWYKIDEGFGSNTDIQAIRNAVPYGQLSNNVFQGAGDAYYEAEALCPIDGNVIVEIFKETGGQQGGLFGVHSIEVSASDKGNIKSKDYIARRNGATSTALKDTVTVYNGDSESDLFVGTIYKSDSDTPTDFWSRYYLDGFQNVISKNDHKELLEIVVGETLDMNQRPMTVFEGDFKGYIQYLNYFTIDTFLKTYPNGQTIPKQFQFLKWSYSFDTDITKFLAREVEWEDLPIDSYNVKIYENFSNENKINLVS